MESAWSPVNKVPGEEGDVWMGDREKTGDHGSSRDINFYNCLNFGPDANINSRWNPTGINTA